MIIDETKNIDTPSDIEDMEHKSGNEQSHEQDSGNNLALEVCKEEIKHWQDKFYRVVADLENYRRRAAKDQERFVFQTQADFLVDILDIVDDVDRAIAQAPEHDANTTSWITGFLLIQKKLYSLLQKYNVKEITAESNIAFDPELHDAIAHVDSEDIQSGLIVNVFQKGFLLNETVLRPAKVSVSK
ncbi:MAG TPA: nucleotide exchange factor GrpE [Candidatus Babeliales bacterium]|nr:nucleotide exchange factor GrpE [Candidatus Babeliales bacterium]